MYFISRPRYPNMAPKKRSSSPRRAPSPKRAASPTRSRKKTKLETEEIPLTDAAQKLFKQKAMTRTGIRKHIGNNEKDFGERGAGTGLSRAVDLTPDGEAVYGRKTVTLGELYSQCGKAFVES